MPQYVSKKQLITVNSNVGDRSYIFYINTTVEPELKVSLVGSAEESTKLNS